MKIIHITAAYKPAFIYGGPTMSVAKLCEALVGVRDIDVEVLTTTANGKKELAVSPGKIEVVNGVDVTYFKRLTKDHTHFSPALLLGLRNVILHHASDVKPQKVLNDKTDLKKDFFCEVHNDKTIVIHIHAWWNLVSIMSCWVAKWYNIPVVLSPRGMLTQYTLGNRNVGFKSIIHSLIGKKLLDYCHIHATSKKEKDDILKFIKPKSITIIPNLVEGVESIKYKVESRKYKVERNENNGEGLNPKDQSSTSQLNNFTTQPALNLIFLSRIEEKKGLALLFKALAQVRFDWSLTIAGSGEEEYVKGLALIVEGLGISSHINWIGQVKNEDKFEILAKHDLMVLTSHNENFANVVIESLSVGTPVLLSNEVGLSDYVKEKEFGWITTLEIESIRENLNSAYSAVTLREKIRTEAPKLIKTDFNDEALVKKYINLYEHFSTVTD